MASPAARTTTLHGSSRPIARSADSARWRAAVAGPEDDVSSICSPSFCRSVDCTSISVSTPKPCALSASRICVFASANEAAVRTVIAYSTGPAFLVAVSGVARTGPRAASQAQEQLLHLLLGHLRLVVRARHCRIPLATILNPARPAPGTPRPAASPRPGSHARPRSSRSPRPAGPERAAAGSAPGPSHPRRSSSASLSSSVSIPHGIVRRLAVRLQPPEGFTCAIASLPYCNKPTYRAAACTSSRYSPACPGRSGAVATAPERPSVARDGCDGGRTQPRACAGRPPGQAPGATAPGNGASAASR